MSSSATLTTTHLPHLRTILEEWEKTQPPPTDFALPLAESVSNSTHAKENAKDMVVAFRTRPPLPNEAASKFTGNDDGTGNPASDTDIPDAPKIEMEYCAGITVASAEPGIFVAHVPGMKWSGPTLAHKSYDADLAFGPAVSNEEVYQRTVVANDVIPLVLSGGIGCILAYGQTGSGKTFTMEGIESRVARDLFDTARTVGNKFLSTHQGLVSSDAIPSGEDVFEFTVTFLELLGKHATDLVGPSGEKGDTEDFVRREVAINEDKIGNVKPQLLSTGVHSSTELEELIVRSLSHRRTSATLRNAASSRSHALLTITVKNTLLPYEEEGQLILVDLAGSERYEDSKAHDKQRMEESRDNNKSLMNLKECVRAKAKMASEDGFVHIPWRSNKLTLLLKPIFHIESRQPSRTIIIAHVSPHIQDSVHSTNTLSYAAPFKTAPPQPRGPARYDPTDPRTWDQPHTHAWLKAEFAKRLPAGGPSVNDNDTVNAGDVNIGIDINRLCPPGYTARNIGAMYTTDFVTRCLECRTPLEDGSREAFNGAETETLMNVAYEVVGELIYLILTAKTRTRNAIMKSRKGRVVEETYGVAPASAAGIDNRSKDLDLAELMNAQTYHGDAWDQGIVAAVEEARAHGKDTGGVQDAARRAGDALVVEWREEKARRKTVDAEGEV